MKCYFLSQKFPFLNLVYRGQTIGYPEVSISEEIYRGGGELMNWLARSVEPFLNIRIHLFNKSLSDYKYEISEKYEFFKKKILLFRKKNINV